MRIESPSKSSNRDSDLLYTYGVTTVTKLRLNAPGEAGRSSESSLLGRRSRISLLLVVAAIALLSLTHDVSAAVKLPARLTDAEFWTLIADLSEPNGTFRSDNLLSNEARFQFVLPQLADLV